MSFETAQEIFGWIDIANAIAVVAAMAVGALLSRRLKKLSPPRWEELRSSSSIGWQLGFLRYIFGTGHKELNDRLFDRLAIAFRTLFGMVILFLALCLGLVSWALYIHPPQGGLHYHPLNRYGVLLVVLIAANFAVSSILMRNLERSHPQIWAALGSPSPFLNNTFSNGWKRLKFIWSGEHRKLADVKLSVAIYSERLVSVSTLIAFVIAPFASR